MSRFVILAHDWPHPHFDLMIEVAGVLRTWRLSELPRGKSVADRPAERLGDHRLAYLDYEGPVSGGRGTVRRIDAGTCVVIRDEPEHFEAIMTGAIICGRLTIADGRCTLTTPGPGPG